MPGHPFLLADAEVQIRRLDDSGAAHKACVVGAGDKAGDYRLRWVPLGVLPDGAPRVGSLVRLIRRAVTGEMTAVRGMVEAVDAAGLIIHTSGTVSAYEKRGQARVSVGFPLSYRKLTDEQVPAVRREIAEESTAADECRRATTDDAGVVGRHCARAVDLSGSGLRLQGGGPLSEGDQIVVRFEIPGAAGGRVRAILEVVRRIGEGDIAGRFRAMSVASRAAVVSHVFERKRREQTPSDGRRYG